MKIIQTADVNPKDLSAQERDWVYNGLDTCVTSEILGKLTPQLDNYTAATYSFSRELQGPCLEMRMRGVLIDRERVARALDEYYGLMDRLSEQLEKIVGEGWGMWEFNWRPNSRDPAELFYRRMGIPPVKKAGKATADRDALEKLEGYFIAAPIAAHIILLREIFKKVQVLRTEIDPDGRIRTSYNIAGTTTGRLSSSYSEFGTGTNLQNIEEILRGVFIADPGMKMAYIDKQQGESRIVGAIEWNLFKDGRYLDACETGDLHTTVAKLCWPHLPWTGDLEHDRKLAEEPYYRHYSRRFMCKRIGHGSNYAGKPRTLAEQAKVDVGAVEDFQTAYFKTFPAHLRWHANVEQRLAEDGYLISLTNRKRYFFGRLNDDSTIREAIAFDPQGSLADILDSGMLEVWKHRDCQLLMQIHDAVLVQYPEACEDEVIPKLLEQLKSPIELEQGRRFIIPSDVLTGWNWGKFDEEKNPDGLKTWEGGDQRKRQPKIDLLDRSFRGVHRQHRHRGDI